MGVQLFFEMTNLYALFVAVALVFTSGCSVLLPKKVEFFQDKVATFPEAKLSEKETQRQAAAMAAVKAEQVLLAAVSNHVPESVVSPAKDVAVLTEAVALSVGPPAKPWGGTATNLAAKLDSSVASLNRRVDSFKADNNSNAGKKIEGTGVFQVGYFSMLAVLLGGLALLWVGLKLYGLVNPVVGLGTNVVGRVASTALNKAVAEVTEGGEWFKEYLAESDLDDQIKSKVKELFSRAHVEAQSRDTQALVERLTIH